MSTTFPFNQSVWDEKLSSLVGLDAVLEILRRAKGRIADPQHWTRCVNARNDSNEEVSARNTGACRWCARGAVLAETSDVDLQDAAILILAAAVTLMPNLTWSDTAHYNDQHSHAEVLAWFDWVIEQLEAKSLEGNPK